MLPTIDKVEFVNATGHPIWLPGPNGEKVQFAKFERKQLSEWYNRYVPRYLKVIKSPPPASQPASQPTRTYASPALVRTGRPVITQPIVRQVPTQKVPLMTSMPGRPRKIVGQVGMHSNEATQYLNQLVRQNNLSISNDIGIGILSYNRLGCLQRLMDSIRRYTDMAKTTVFISDESTDQNVRNYLGGLVDTVIVTGEHIGVAGNSNRLFRCLDRFRFKILLNDDVEILSSGWEIFYTGALAKTGLHHFCYRQIGVYGAKPGECAIKEIDGLRIATVGEKPHGAVMAFDQKAFETVGYFDESFGPYGMEHVDWSNRVSLSGIQPPGFHDVVGSESYFKIHSEQSATEDRIRHLNEARKIYDSVRHNNKRIFIQATAQSEVPAISYIVPFRGTDRKDSIKTVLQNIKSQKFPRIEIIMVEQDSETRVAMPELTSVRYVLAQSSVEQPFTKSLAFNIGVSVSTNKKLVLHDADMLVYDGYTVQIDRLLNEHEAVHIGKTVVYLNPESTNTVNNSGKLIVGAQADRSVRYFEGGSLGCQFDAYLKIGGFNEDFVGYGCEDCDFFYRLSALKFYNERSVDLIHLYHNRTQGWKQHHERNKTLEANLKKVPIQDRIKSLAAAFAIKYNLKPR